MSSDNLDIKTLEDWLWEAACKIRGDIDAPKYKDYILPLIFLKRLSDVFDDEMEKLIKQFGNEEIAEELLNDDHSLVRFYIPNDSRWNQISHKTTHIGEYLTDAVRAISRENPKLQGVIDRVDFNASESNQRIITEGKLKSLIDVLGRYRLGLKDVEPDIIGRAYEYLLRKFAEGSGQSAGEFYTPREVAVLMSNILDPEPGESVYDPCCGSGGLLIKCHMRFDKKYEDNNQVAPISYYGQETLHSTYAMAKINIFLHDMAADIKLGDTMLNPAFLNSDGSLKKFDIVTANPMWNQEFTEDTYTNDPYERFNFGYPYESTADWGWIQHMYTSLTSKGKIAVVLDTGSVTRGSGTRSRDREQEIRKAFVEKDLIEAVILLPENLFYNTTAAGIILVINNDKSREDQVLLINASKMYEKGESKNFIPHEYIKQIHATYGIWDEIEGFSKVLSKEDIQKTDYNLIPSRYIALNGEDDTMYLEDAIVLLKEAEEERIVADNKLNEVINKLGL